VCGRLVVVVVLLLFFVDIIEASILIYLISPTLLKHEFNSRNNRSRRFYNETRQEVVVFVFFQAGKEKQKWPSFESLRRK